ncbi:peptidase S8/S53 domain-containing protein [Scenedesmus sp. NREL 46B-D3]|nr:peptidase S8/S53 domain-containing protein [Scenedesmus sp. NREL 46B-D3]
MIMRVGVLLVVWLVACCSCAAAVSLPRGPSRVTRQRITATAEAVGGMHGQSMPVAQRVVPIPAVTISHQGARRASNMAIASDLPAGTPIAGEYIVIYKPSVDDVAAAAAEIQAQATEAAVAAFSSGDVVDAASVDEVRGMVAVLSSTEAPAGIPSQALLQVPVELKEQEIRARLAALPIVESVVQNRVVALQGRLLQQEPAGSDTVGVSVDRPKARNKVASCSAPYFAAGVQAQVAAGVNLQWTNCITSATQLALFGERCGANLASFRWSGLFAYDKATGQQLSNCLYLRARESNATNVRQYFGDCGAAPTMFAGVPTSVCQEGSDASCVDASRVASYTVQTSQPLCSDARSTRVTFQGVPCGPNNALVQWNTMSPVGCSSYARARLDVKQQADWLGQCGVPPFQITGMPTRICGRVPGGGSTPTPPPANPPAANPPPANPPPANPPGDSTGKLPTTPLMSGESTANWGMATIGALDASRNVIDPRAAIAATGFKVVVIDTGAEQSHPDLNVVEFVDFMDRQGSSYFNRDGNGHGTHVAGIIGARNNGAGTSGVVPGMPIVAMKVLGAGGSGSLDVVYKAYAEVLARLQRGERIAAINLSLGAAVTDQNAIATECNWISRIAAYGTAVVVAAGNAGTNYAGTIPALCPDAMTVTSLTKSGSPSSFSNFASSSSAKSSTMIAAPGSDITSTFIGGAYQSMSGTSMACPHVAGAFARCALSGACRISSSPGATPATSTNYPVVLAAARAVPCVGSICGPSWRSANNYGYMLNVRQL